MSSDPGDTFIFDLREHFAEGHPDEEQRKAFLATLAPGSLFAQFGRGDWFWAALDSEVEDAAARCGYVYQEEDDE